MATDKALSNNSTNPCPTNFIRFVWVDYFGIIRCKVIPAAKLGLPVRAVTAVMFLCPWGAVPSPINGATGEHELVPILKSAAVAWRKAQSQSIPSPQLPPRLQLPWHPNHHIIISQFLDSQGQVWSQCPKGALFRAVQLCNDKGLNVKAGFELEFALFTLDPADGKTLRDFGRSASYASFDQVDMAARFLDDVVACLEKMDIYVRMMHAEAMPAQFELVLDYKDVLDAAHDLIVARIAVKAVARKHGLIASFVPNYVDGVGGSGSHVHLSLDGHFGTDDVLRGVKIGVSETGQKFMAGILNELPWLVFLLNSSPLSYARLRPQCWVGAYQVWGDNNKEAPLRLVQDRSNFEVKLLDAVSNADLALAGLLIAGLRGIEHNAQLPPPCQVDPYCIAENERPPLLPDSLEASLELFRTAYRAGRVEQIFTPDMAQDLMIVKQSEIDYVKENGLDAYRQMLLTLH
eukprot:GFKZ01007883.1.p1 GENE.GFKZ01007883.1~~GFKZ01007883.1.p1  ORF type:complete len:523 (+),score=43.74 GFKZ01007883.1:189-1571(+)